MTTYAVSFDLSSDFDQSEFFSTLNSLGEASQVTSSTWLIKSELSAKEIRDTLYSSMTPEERLLVMKSASPAAWKNIMCSNQWLMDNISNKA